MNWSQYPATQNMDMDCHRIVDVSGINFCDGTYIGPGNSFDISSSQVLVLSGTADPSGGYNGASIVSSDRLYQQLNSDPSWNAVNGHYALAKDVAPAVNPYSSGVKAVSTWTARLSASTNSWSSIVWSPELSLFAAVSTNGTTTQAMTSPDGINWTTQTTPSSSQIWRSLCWSPELGLFVAVAGSGTNRVMTSSNGINWILSASAVNTNNWRSVCWSSELGLFVAVSGTATGAQPPAIITSPDGITWTLQSIEANDWRGVCWSPELGLFVAVANSGTGNRVATSPDGIIWTSRTSAADNNWNSVIWSSEQGIFVAVSGTGGSGQPAVMTSIDGINWTLRSAAAANDWRSVCWAPELGIFVAVAITGDGNRVMISPNGIIWSVPSITPDNNWISVCWSPELGIFSAVSLGGTGNNRVMTSSLSGRPPTSYNVFDSSFNQIDQSGNWTIQQVLKSGTVTLTTTPSTQSVAGINLLYISNSTTPRTISNFTGGVLNQRLTVIFTGTTNTTIQNSSAVRLRDGTNFDASANDTLTLLSVADPILITDCSGTFGTNTIFCSSTTGLVIGMALSYVSGSGISAIPANATITSILTSPTGFTITPNLVVTLGNPTLARLIATGIWVELSRSNNV